MSVRTFELGDVLTVTTGCLVSPRGVEAIYDVLNFMTGDNPFTHQLPRACDECRPHILAQHPDLADVTVPAFDNEPHVWRWLAEQVDRFGTQRELVAMEPSDHTRIDPVAELRMMRPDLPIIAIEVDPS